MAVFLLQSPDGDVIDCVLSYLQHAFDHPMLKGHKPLVIFHLFPWETVSFSQSRFSYSCVSGNSFSGTIFPSSKQIFGF